MRTAALVLGAVVALAAACSDDKKNGPEVEAPQGTGTLVVTATLPVHGPAPTFRASGPDGEVTLGAPDPLAPFELPVGNYTLRGDTVRAGTYLIGNFVPETTPTFTITKDQQTTAQVEYALADDGTGRVWSPVYDLDPAMAGIATFKEALDDDDTTFRVTHERIILPAGSIPQTLATDATGAIWVGDYGMNRVMKFSPSALLLEATPAPEVTLDIGLVTGYAFSPTGDLYVAADQAVIRFTPGQLAVSGAPLADATFTDQLDGASGLAFAANGDLWITNYTSSQVIQFTAANLASKTDEAGVVLTSRAYNDGSGSIQTLAGPLGILISGGNMWIANNEGYRSVIQHAERKRA